MFGSTERLFISGIPAVNPVEIDFHKLDHGKSVSSKLQYKVRARMIHPEDEDAGTVVTAPRGSGPQKHTAPRDDGSDSHPELGPSRAAAGRGHQRLERVRT